MDTNLFIEKAIKIHENKYDYSKVQYINKNTPVCIICPVHGEFWQTPEIHLKGCGCRKCSIEKQKNKQTFTREEFIRRAKEKHGNKYDYSKVEYVNSRTKVCIICPIHGEFWQMPNEHLKGRGCRLCGNLLISEKKKKTTTESLIKHFKEVWPNNEYDYSDVVFNGWKNKVKVYCNKHKHFFEITPGNHLNGQGCRDCMAEKISTSNKKDFQLFLKQAIEIHGNKYKYDESSYNGSTSKIKITCPIHGEFWQRARDHVNGKSGCPKCRSSKLEQDVSNILIENSFTFEYQKTFGWLKSKNNMKLDFYLPKKKIAIECQGEQHFRSVDYFGGEESFFAAKKRDELKKELCEAHGITVLYYSEKKYENNLITEKAELIDKINSIK